MESVDGPQEIGDQPETQEIQVSNEVGLGDFKQLRVLGRGVSATVSLVRKLSGPDRDRLYALKQISKEFALSKPKRTEHVLDEREVLGGAPRCPFHVAMHYAFQTDASLYLVLDFVQGGELYELYSQMGFFNERETLFYMAEIVVALEKLHSRGIAYRDLKPENVLLDAKGHVVLADFGLSKDLRRHSEVQRAFSYCGTYQYFAPEQTLGCNADGYDFTVDWWALGVLSYELLASRNPFASKDHKRNSIKHWCRRVQQKEPEAFPPLVTPTMQGFVLRLLEKDPSQRLGAGGVREIKGHRVFSGVDWAEVAARKCTPPFKPKLTPTTDVSNFKWFSALPAEESVTASPSHDNDVFKDYAFSAPTKTAPPASPPRSPSLSPLPRADDPRNLVNVTYSASDGNVRPRDVTNSASDVTSIQQNVPTTTR